MHFRVEEPKELGPKWRGVEELKELRPKWRGAEEPGPKWREVKELKEPGPKWKGDEFGLQLLALKNELGYYRTLNFSFGARMNLNITRLKISRWTWALDFGFEVRMNSDITGLKILVLEDGLGLQILALK
ncbi:hypothetical protein RhiirA1_471892 [Rhizophagus irregularis]|uniref:Uncharacterized protein n=1 Tax=Rhizophagus irregularis TaxID=588596 RepID=A0A2N0R3D3_9GLOM|nr:hypothetical protein RhiirA1_477248 [Rhizophagus irregularis]PKC57817.1 hypothetical protein RhiirA1_471892 [Rhizophagus irregularis]